MKKLCTFASLAFFSTIWTSAAFALQTSSNVNCPSADEIAITVYGDPSNPLISLPDGYSLKTQYIPQPNDVANADKSFGSAKIYETKPFSLPQSGLVVSSSDIECQYYLGKRPTNKNDRPANYFVITKDNSAHKTYSLGSHWSSVFLFFPQKPAVQMNFCEGYDGTPEGDNDSFCSITAQ